MQALSIPLLICLAAVAFGFPESQIVGGKDAPNGMFPYQVSIRENGRHFCGGSIISNRHILTAAHCVEDLTNLKRVTVHAGTNQLNSAGESFGVERVVAHAGFNGHSLVNDVAVIRVNRNIVFNKMVKAIPLATGGSYDGSNCVLSGWGLLRASGPLPNNLQYINLRIQNLAQCKMSHSNVVSSHICTFTKYGEGACNGDSGGPLVVNGVQVGIVSFGIPCGVGKPDVYTRVSSFGSWIKQQEHYLQYGGVQPAESVYIA